VSKALHLLIVEDHAVVRAGLRRLLGESLELVIHEAVSAEDALLILAHEPVHIAILDINLPGMGGLELLHRMSSAAPQVKVLVFTMLTDAIYAARAMGMGARGYISKSAAPGELLAAMDAILLGNIYVEAEIAIELRNFETSATEPLPQLTARDLEIMRLLAQGQSLAGISETLGIAYKTAANTVSRLKEKVGASTTAELVRLSLSHLPTPRGGGPG